MAALSPRMVRFMHLTKLFHGRQTISSGGESILIIAVWILILLHRLLLHNMCGASSWRSSAPTHSSDHTSICFILIESYREDGAVLDFSGSNFVNIDDFAFGAVARYLQLDREKCCFPPNLVGHTCKHRYRHAEFGTAITWDDALRSSMHHFEHKSYNLFTCNCHSFIANCLNRLCYGGKMGWNMVNVAALVLFKGQWVDTLSILRSFLPFTLVLCLGIFMVGWPFLIGLLSFSLLLIGWFLFGTYCVKSLLEC